MILHRALRPSLYISFLATSWGAIMLCHGFVYDYEGLLTVRSLLGVFQYVSPVVIYAATLSC